MSRAVQIIDETIGARQGSTRQNGPRLKLVSKTMTVRELIAERVSAEWMVRQPKNDREPRSRKELALLLQQWESLQFAGSQDAAIKMAEKAFAAGEFLFFWNDDQILDPDQRLNILEDNEALFVRLLPLKGG